VTLRDVAQRAGVSVATVSLVVNDKAESRTGEATRQRVRQAINELGYRKNALASSLVRGQSTFIGFVADAIATTPFAGKIIRGAQEEAWKQGYVLLVADTNGIPDITNQAIEMMADHRAHGVLYSTWYHRDVEPPAALQGLNTVFVNCRARTPGSYSVVPDEEQGGAEATNTLIRRGHRRIAFINATDDAPSTRGRLRGYRAALRSAGIEYDPRLVLKVFPEQEGGYAAAASLLALPQPPSAVFCYNDRVAMGLYDCMRDHQVRIPEDIAVVGFDDQEVIAAHLRPALSTIALPHYDIGARSVRALLEGRPGEMVDSRVELVPCPPVIRESAG
jgi:LacI family transcriptional regulator